MAETVFIDEQEALQVESFSPEVRRALAFTADSLQGVTATGAGGSVYVGGQEIVTLVVAASAVTTGGTILLEGCRKDSGTAGDWYTIGTITATANKSYYLQVINEWHLWVRANVSARTDGTYSAYWGLVPRKDSR